MPLRSLVGAVLARFEGFEIGRAADTMVVREVGTLINVREIEDMRLAGQWYATDEFHARK